MTASSVIFIIISYSNVPLYITKTKEFFRARKPYKGRNHAIKIKKSRKPESVPLNCTFSLVIPAASCSARTECCAGDGEKGVGIGVQGLLPESSPSSLLASSPAIPSARCSGIIPRLFTSTCPTTQHQELKGFKVILLSLISLYT